MCCVELLPPVCHSSSIMVAYVYKQKKMWRIRTMVACGISNDGSVLVCSVEIFQFEVVE